MAGSEKMMRESGRSKGMGVNTAWGQGPIRAIVSFS